MKKALLLVGVGLLGCGSSTDDSLTTGSAAGGASGKGGSSSAGASGKAASGGKGTAGSGGTTASGGKAGSSGASATGGSGTAGNGGTLASSGAAGSSGSATGGSGASAGTGGNGASGTGGTGTGGSGTGGADTGGTGGTDAAGSGGTGAAGSGGATCTGGTSTTAGVECAYAHSAFNSSASVKTDSTVDWSCSATLRSVVSNGIPDHDVGTFPNANCPNTISAYSVSATMTLTPVNTGTASKIGVVGYALNGVKLDPSTAGTCSVSGGTATCSLIGNTGSWNIEALGQSSFNFGVDANNAHVQPTGEYHYHGMPEGVLGNLGQGMAPTLVGFALDGFPVYARYGYSDAADAGSPVKKLTGSYQLKANADSGRPSTATYPMGAFTQDYEYVAGSGDLDECNGRTGVTPEFPCGIYHYYITDTYPFIQRCVKGTAMGGTGAGGMGGGGGPGGTGGETGGPPACSAGQTSMCCGDGKCDGPETKANCAADCP